MGQEPVVFTEPAGQCLGEFGDLGPQPAFGEFGQCGRVALAIDQRLEHRPPGHPTDVGGHG